MPLPNNSKMAWPPESESSIYSSYAEHDAWYAGDMLRLANLYASRVYSPTPKGAHWAKEIREEKRVMVHVPVAADISATSAAMLFSEHPKIKIPEAYAETPDADVVKSQGRLDEIIQESGFYSTCSEAAEVASALGGVFLKVNWDKSLAPYPILQIAQPDNAIPEFRFGILTTVTFWTTLDEDNDTVWRLLERHEPGTIETGLYKGTHDTLGDQYPLTYRTDTSGMVELVKTGIEGLACRYIPNMKPNRRLRGSCLGQSDYAGSESLMDSLDEVFTSLMRDFRLGQGRIIAPESFFQKSEDGEFRMDVDKEVYLALSAPYGGESAAKELTLNQFNIRTQEHLDATQALLRQILSNAGYSPQSFGLDIDGQAESGTALTIRERKSFITAAKKAEYWKPALEDLCEMILVIDNKHLGSDVTPYRPTVEMQDSVTSDVAQVATSVELVNRAAAASIETKIRMLHPDWDAEQVEAEKQRILDEQGLNVPDPTTLGRGAE